jgi:hypothetical protein
MSKTGLRAVVLVAVIALLGVASYAIAGGSKHKIKDVTLEGYQETLTAISTTGAGSFEANIAKDDESLSYTLSFSGLEGTVLQAHIHFGAPAQSGGISAWLCRTATNPGPIGNHLPDCPQSGKITGVIHPDDVIGPTGQGIEPGAFPEFLAAIRSGYAYANVHTVKWPSGEIRAQINDDDGEKDD